MFAFHNDTASSSTPLHTPTFFGLSIPTHRLHGSDPHGDDALLSSSFAHFPYEPIIAAIAIVFFRITVKLHRPASQQEEPLLLRYLFAVILGICAYTQQSYQHIAAVELSSYMISYVVLYVVSQSPTTTMSMSTGNKRTDHEVPRRPPRNTSIMLSLQRFVFTLIGTIVSVGLSYGIVISCCNPVLQRYFMQYIVPNAIQRAFLYLFPILELQKAYTIMEQFMLMEQEFFHHMIHHLFFVTFHIQVGMGYLGIAFLRSEQSRRNQLIRLDVYDEEVEEINTADDVDNIHSPQQQQGIHQNGTTTNGHGSLTKQEHKKNKKRDDKAHQMSEKSRIFQRGAAPFSTFILFLLSFGLPCYPDLLIVIALTLLIIFLVA